MKSKEVLLREHVTNLGRCGEVVRVRPGFARNFLFPRRLAIDATEDNKRAMARRAERLAADDAVVAARVAETVSAMSGMVVRTRQRADEQGHLYGSVNAALVAELLTRAGQATDERSVRLDAPIKSVGSHAVSIHVHGEQHASVTVLVEAE